MTGRVTGRVRGAAVAVVLAATVGACGTVSERRDDVREATRAFQQHLADGAYDRVCAALAPGTVEELEHSAGSPCAEALGEEAPPRGGALRGVDVYGNQARAVLATDTLFLSRFDSGWKIVAAGCTERPGQPYRCRIKGG
ncbi:hypothetical protein K4B79_08870 [Streptomyces lincolnensis]|uniref:hypothetical protein n=1 Tax=Streptomyces lincolnensis TaxID=1915 RepID=UPI001E478804|nr:hypothetical protein [Streptomyces lincolnensis]MCD7438344.1 hypothetical protein [Streptomyces lincolnensis]